MHTPTHSTTLRLGGSLLAVCMLAACAAAPLAPNDALQAADIAIRNADDAKAAEHAPLEMTTAREKITAARAAVAAEDMRLARRLADEAQVNANLAKAKADTAKAKAANTEVQKGIDSMKQEIDRNTGGKS